VNGKAEVKIDAGFANTVALSNGYHVFLSPHNTKIAGLAVMARGPTASVSSIPARGAAHSVIASWREDAERRRSVLSGSTLHPHHRYYLGPP
jgi:hypothetical protein